MDSIVCRDCGMTFRADSRGCNNCALNLEAEKMIGQFVWRRLVPGLIILGGMTAGAFYYLMR